MLHPPENLEEVLHLIWQLLGRAAVDKKDPIHALNLTTYDGNFPLSRTVILRKFLEAESTLVVHTDVRAGKVEEISRHPQVSWLAWHSRKRVQLRMKGMAQVHRNQEIWEKEWASLSATSRLNYSSRLPPSETISSAEEGWNSYATLTPETLSESNTWKNNFCVITSHLLEIDFLLLERAHHRRATFSKEDTGWKGMWKIP